MISNIWTRGQLSDWLQIAAELKRAGINLPSAAVAAVQAAHDAHLPQVRAGKPSRFQTYTKQVICKRHKTPTTLLPCESGYFCVECLDELNGVK